LSRRNDATDSYVGYIHQGRYALVALLEAKEADAVSVETDDDVVLEGRETTLSQLKHSLGTPPDLRLSNVGLWKALRIWAEHELARHAAGEPASTRYCFVTVAGIANGDVLESCTMAAPRVPSVDQAICDALGAEAQRVLDARAAPRPDNGAAPHAERVGGCQAFLALSPEMRLDLVSRTTILPRSFRVTEIESRVAANLEGSARAEVRPRVAERLVEWWDGQVARALTRRRDRRIMKEEVAGRTNDLLIEYREDTLPDQFSALKPTPEDLAADRASNIARQIELVRGGGSRIDRAIVARWRARGQRERWLLEDVSRATILEQFDDRLKEAWADRHGPMSDDCVNAGEDERCTQGRRLLDWAHATAHIEVPPPRPDWRFDFYAHGMLHQFADELTIGWHPDFRARLGPPLSGAPSPGDEPDGSPIGPSDHSRMSEPGRRRRRGGENATGDTSGGTGGQDLGVSPAERTKRATRATTPRRQQPNGDTPP